MYTQELELMMLYSMVIVFTGALLFICFTQYVKTERHIRRSRKERRRFYEYCDYTHRIIARIGNETVCGEVLFSDGAAKQIACDNGFLISADCLSEEDIREIEEATVNKGERK